MTFRHRALGAAAGAALLALGGPARAQLAVYDPANHAENVLQALRALQTITHQVESLQNEARNLLPLGLSAAAALNGDIARINGLLGEARRLAGDLPGLRAQYQQQYAAAPFDLSSRARLALAQSRWRNSLDALQHALEVQAEIGRAMASTTRQAEVLAEASQGAQGALQAAQAGNQLLAVQSKQLADLTALLAAAGQAEALEQSRAAAERADGRARLARFLEASR